MLREDIKKEAMKKEIGKRFKEFRQAINKTQHELADELNVNQSTIASIEIGKIFPVIPIQLFLNQSYNLNINWLLNEKGEMFLTAEDKKSKESKFPGLPLLFCHIKENDPRFERYVELIRLMRISFVEQIIFAKLEEIKAIAKDEIKSILGK
jgi:transcriptional regulator with XRE-family HTH domain